MKESRFYYLVYGTNLEDIDEIRRIFLEDFSIDLDEEDEDDEPWYCGHDEQEGRIDIHHNLVDDEFVEPDHSEFSSLIFIRRPLAESPLDRKLLTHHRIRAEKLRVIESVESQDGGNSETRLNNLYERPKTSKQQSE